MSGSSDERGRDAADAAEPRDDEKDATLPASRESAGAQVSLASAFDAATNEVERDEVFARLFQKPAEDQLPSGVAGDFERGKVFAQLFQKPAEHQQLGRYTVTRTLGKGGMGTVLVAFDQALDRQVAIKVLSCPSEESSDLLQRFEREAQIIAQLQHPHIVQIYDYGIARDQTPYIVMELLEGEDLSQTFERMRGMPLRAVVPLVVQAVRGLQAAHRAGVIHRDLKPANLFLARQAGEQILKILDFGIATAQHTEPVPSEGVYSQAGTPSYMSPEQVRGKEIDHRTDLWSLAVVAYEALTGTVPFHGRNVPDIVMRIVQDPPIPPSRTVDSLGPAVDEFFERALAKDPDERFSSAQEFGAAFSALERSLERRAAVILVVDDEPDFEALMRVKFRRLIRRGEYELLFARDGQAALDQLALRPDVDVIITDLNMPGMDGLTLLGRLGRAGPALRAVVLSAYNDMPNIRAAMNAGAYDFLTKPLDFSDLEATLRKAVHDARELRQALRAIEENDALRLFVDDALLDRLLPLLRVSSDVSGETLDATVVSIDVHGVRRQMEQGPASAVFERLNRTFDIVVPIVNAWQGIVVSFVGDAVLAVFHGEDHLERGCNACLAARAALSRTGATDHESGSSPVAPVCIGMDSGPVVSGSIGSKTIKRLNYTVLGEVVSRALALERRAREGQFLARREVAIQLAPYFECHPLDEAPRGDLGVVYDIEGRRTGDERRPEGSTIPLRNSTIPLDDSE